MSHRRFSKWWILFAGVPVLLLVFVLIFVTQAKSFLKSDRFRTFLAGKVSQTIKAKGSFQALEWSGTSFYTEGFSASGGDKLLGEIEAQQIRAELDLSGLWEKKWQVNEVQIERLKLAPGSPREQPVMTLPDVKPEPQRTTETGMKAPGFLTSWLPNRVVVKKVSVADFSFDGRGLKVPVSLDGLRVEAAPEGNAWELSAEGGALTVEKFPKLNVTELRLRYVESTLFVSRGTLTTEGGGQLEIIGKVETRSPTTADLEVKLQRLPAATVLPEDWRARLHGNLSGELKVTNDGKDWVATGPVRLADGRLEGLPVLDQIALFTRTQRFRQLNLDNVRADLTVEKDKVTAANVNAESPGLIRITGNFVVKKGKMKGEFLVGVTPASLRYIPGSQEKVFTMEREGYWWTTMKVSGPVDHLKEDLSGRLATAAGQEIIDSLQNNPSKLKDTLKDAAQSLLDLLGK